MAPSLEQKNLLKTIPSIDHILLKLQQEDQFKTLPRSVLLTSSRTILNDFRQQILKGTHEFLDADTNQLVSFLIENIKKTIIERMTPNLKGVINATGIVVHTNLGRSPLSVEALNNVTAIAGHYSNLEYDLRTGRRGLRYTHVEDLLCEVTGAEAALAVNNNAAAVLLCLDTLASGKEVIVSRGELVEIGGTFRIPDIMGKSGAILKEIGTTNRTHLGDYENAVTENTGLFLKVHPSNFSIQGFVKNVPMAEITRLADRYAIPTLNDLGSGTLIDLSHYGLEKEPTVQDALKDGADIVTFSGDKLLGGPQAGIILGQKRWLDSIKNNPLTRALRIDKMTLAALESTLRLYRNEAHAVHAIPTLRMLTTPVTRIEEKALQLKALLESVGDSRLRVRVLPLTSRAGGGALPLLELPSRCVAVTLKDVSPHSIAEHMRHFSSPVIGRIEKEQFIMDLRTVREKEFRCISKALRALLSKVAG